MYMYSSSVDRITPYPDDINPLAGKSAKRDCLCSYLYRVKESNKNHCPEKGWWPFHSKKTPRKHPNCRDDLSTTRPYNSVHLNMTAILSGQSNRFAPLLLSLPAGSPFLNMTTMSVINTRHGFYESLSNEPISSIEMLILCEIYTANIPTVHIREFPGAGFRGSLFGVF